MATARFKIEDKHQVIQDIPKTESWAGIYFSIKVNGGVAEIPRRVEVTHKGLSVHFGSCSFNGTTPSAFGIRQYGKWMSQSELDSNRLVEWKPVIKGALAEIAREIVRRELPTRLAVEDLLTNTPLAQEPEPKIVVEYSFIDPVVMIKPTQVMVPSRLFFSCTATPPQEVSGHAGGLTVHFTILMVSSVSFEAPATLHFSHTGWLSNGDHIDQLRAKFSDDIIEAAFKDLAAKWLELDTSPKDAVEWHGVTTTKTMLV